MTGRRRMLFMRRDRGGVARALCTCASRKIQGGAVLSSVLCNLKEDEVVQPSGSPRVAPVTQILPRLCALFAKLPKEYPRLPVRYFRHPSGGDAHYHRPLTRCSSPSPPTAPRFSAPPCVHVPPPPRVASRPSRPSRLPGAHPPRSDHRSTSDCVTLDDGDVVAPPRVRAC